MQEADRELLAGVMWIRRGDELIAYSESARYTNQVCRLTHDAVGDSLSVVHADEPQEVSDE